MLRHDAGAASATPLESKLQELLEENSRMRAIIRDLACQREHWNMRTADTEAELAQYRLTNHALQAQMRQMSMAAAGFPHPPPQQPLQALRAEPARGSEGSAAAAAGGEGGSDQSGDRSRGLGDGGSARELLGVQARGEGGQRVKREIAEEAGGRLL